MENLTNEEKANELIAGDESINISTVRLLIKDKVLEMAQWKDEQHKQELIRIYNFVSPYLTPEANNDLKIIIGI